MGRRCAAEGDGLLAERMRDQVSCGVRTCGRGLPREYMARRQSAGCTVLTSHDRCLYPTIERLRGRRQPGRNCSPTTARNQLWAHVGRVSTDPSHAREHVGARGAQTSLQGHTLMPKSIRVAYASHDQYVFVTHVGLVSFSMSRLPFTYDLLQFSATEPDPTFPSAQVFSGPSRPAPAHFFPLSPMAPRRDTSRDRESIPINRRPPERWQCIPLYASTLSLIFCAHIVT